MKKILFDDNWKFHKGDVSEEIPSDKGWMYHQAKTERNLWGAPSVAYNDEMWETVSLPHDYIIEQTPSRDGNQGLGYLCPENAWYRKKFILDDGDKDKRICLYFEGIATNSEVWLNGSLIKRNFAGYYGFEADISDFVRFDRENVLAVYVNTTDNHEGWWYEGGGIYRHVWLEKYEQISVDRFGIYIEPKKIDMDNWSADCEVTVRNDLYEDCNVTVRTEIIDKDVTVCSTKAEITIPRRDSHSVMVNMKVEKPHLWDIDDPYQYMVRANIFVDGTETDCREVMFGFRSFECKGDGMILNDKPIFLNGVCAHQDFGLCGKAVPDNIQRYKVGLIKEMGANAYRCSHYPHSEITMDELDRLGFVVMDEVRRFESTEEGLEQLRMLIKRDRNRPSVFFWSVGNEEPISLTENGRRIFAAMKAEIRKLDKTRPVMCALSERPDETTFLENCDVIGINYNLNKYDAIHEHIPGKMIFASECCASGTTRGWYFDDCPEKGYINAIDKDPDAWFAGRERTWKFLSSREWIAGGFQWIAFEHRGECLWPRLCSQSGAIDMFMQKKDAFYQNQSFWSEKPMIHLLPDWNFDGLEGEEIRVVCYTNCEEAELFLNGSSLGRLRLERFDHGEWHVPYTKGVLSVIGYIGGEAVCSDEKKTSKKAAALMLRQENFDVSDCGRDVALITCTCIDEEGTEVPDAAPYVRFAVKGEGRIIGTGSDISDHIPPNVTDRQMRAGRVLAGVLIGRNADEVKVYACTDGLKSAVCRIEIKRNEG